ncbi:MAG: 30S ribosome-binding factor RbfA [Phycisphaerae bacterium]
MSRRLERIASLIRSLVAEAILTRLSDPRIPPVTSITRVEIAPDLASARIHVSVLAADAKRELCIDALRQAAGRLRAYVGDHVTMRHVPRLVFQLDDSVRRGSQTVESLDRLMAEAGARQAARAQAADADAMPRNDLTPETPASEFEHDGPLAARREDEQA